MMEEKRKTKEKNWKCIYMGQSLFDSIPKVEEKRDNLYFGIPIVIDKFNNTMHFIAEDHEGNLWVDGKRNMGIKKLKFIKLPQDDHNKFWSPLWGVDHSILDKEIFA